MTTQSYSPVIVICLTVLALASAAAVTVLVVVGHATETGLVAVAVGPIIASIVGYAGSAKSSASAAATASSAQAHIDTTVQRLSNGGLDTAVRQTLNNIQVAAVQEASTSATP